MIENKKVLVGISGGVDSSVAIFLLKDQGFEPIGITLKVIENTKNSKFEKEIERTAKLCKKLDIQHIVKYVVPEFYENIIKKFAETYFAGETPNPCVICNKFIKWKFILSEADKRGIKYIATGHYVIVKKENNNYQIFKGFDQNKDQSYYLWQLGQKELSRTIFPIGEYTKEKIKSIAREHNLVPESLSESQDICFIPDNDYRNYLVTNFPEKFQNIGKGEMIDTNGKILGYHDGFYNFTIGQRKGFKMGFSGRRYVKNIDAEKNQIIIANNDQIFSKGMIIDSINFPSNETDKNFVGNIKIRYNSKGVNSKVEILENNRAKIIFDEPQRAVTPGQSAVLYIQNKVILGGIIKEIL